jgi:ubiquinone/menaquinone biosynthesis C-methylase UbiE
MLERVLEPEVMDTPDEARDYDEMDHSAVNRAFAADFFSTFPHADNPLLDVGTGTAQIPIEMCRQSPRVALVAIDLADEMLRIAARNVSGAGFGKRIKLEKVNGRELAYPYGHFAAVVSNSIIHHIPNPTDCFAEMVRVCRPGGALFVRDLLRPESEEELTRLVKTYAGDANDHQRTLFANSLRAALSLDDVRSIVGGLGFASDSVRQTTDRHWTFAATKPTPP